MKFSCVKTDLERAAIVAERFTGKQTTLPALGQVLVSADANGIMITGTNLEHAVEIRVPARVMQQGRVSVPAKIFALLLQSLSEGQIECRGEKGSLYVKTDSRESRINGAGADDFPLIPTIKKTGGFSVDAVSLGRALSRVLPAVSLSDFKPELSGVFFRAGKEEVTLCATDTFRLAEATVPMEKNSADGAVSFILPHRSAVELSRLVDGEEGGVTISAGENQITAEVGRALLTSRLADGAFPDYKAIIPSGFATSAYLAKEDMIRGVKAASIFSSKLQEITVRLSGKEVEIRATNPEVGEYRTEYPASLSGREIALSFNWRYFLDGLQQLEDNDIFFGCNDTGTPALLRNKSNSAFAYVVMPIRLT